MMRGHGMAVQIVDKNDRVDVIVQETDGSVTYYDFFRTLAACRKAVGAIEDTAPHGDSLDKYR